MKANTSVGVVKTQYFKFGEPPDEMVLDSGVRLGPITLAYETYGRLNKKKDNAILLLHALSGDAHAAGLHGPNDKKPGWWDDMTGPGKPFDTDRYFLVCSNIIGGCKGSTGPSSEDPKTGKPYALNFPVITIRDMVRAQKRLIDHLGIKKLLSVCGGSIGGMQALRWAKEYPDSLYSCVPIASSSRISAQAIAFNEVGRRAIMADPNWNDGNYYETSKLPINGLAIARMVGHITYLSDSAMHKKFGRDFQAKEKYGYDFSIEFKVESYLNYQGLTFTQRFDANSYLYLTKAMDYYDLTEGTGNLTESLRHVKSKFLIISFSSDWLFPPYQSEEIVKALKLNGKDVTYCQIDSIHGHDAFLLDMDSQSRMIRNFLYNVEKEFNLNNE